MKAMLLKGPGQPFALETVPDPEPGPGEAVARVYACGSGLTIQMLQQIRSRPCRSGLTVRQRDQSLLQRPARDILHTQQTDPVVRQYLL